LLRAKGKIRRVYPFKQNGFYLIKIAYTTFFLRRAIFLKPFDLIAIFYLFVVALFILIFHSGLHLWWLYFLTHLGIIFLIFFVLPPEGVKRSKWIEFLRYWYPLGLFIFLYEETGALNHLVFKGYFSHIFISIDQWIFGFQPSIEFSRCFSHPFIKEYMSFSYFTYYLLIPFMGTILYSKGKFREFDLLMFSSSMTFYLCFFIFILFPVAGPQFQFPELRERKLEGYIFSEFLNLILEFGEIENGAFPSSHVAIAMVVLLFCYRYEPKIAHFLSFFILMLCISTVYINAHYFIDVPGGIAMGGAGYFIGQIVERNIRKSIEKKRKSY
jgi:membrane-associated phospholipid phosphatase